MKQIDYDNAVAISREIHWVGYYDCEAQLHCNPYVLIEDGGAVFFDPGSIPHFPVVMRKIIDILNPRDISIIVASHEDADVCGNLPVVEDMIERDDLQIVAHSNAIRFIRHYGVRSEFYPVENHDFKLRLKSGRVLEFLHVPYLHSPGAIMTYDRQGKNLFSGDLFGALSGRWSLFAGPGFLEPMAEFHRIYMPANKILKQCMERLEPLEIQRILPQHGSVLEGKQVRTAIEFLKTLTCGIDLLDR
jgi:flavorubredoxin